LSEINRGKTEEPSKKN